MVREDLVGRSVVLTATLAEGEVVGRIAAENPEFDLYRIEFPDGSAELFERDEFRL